MTRLLRLAGPALKAVALARLPGRRAMLRRLLAATLLAAPGATPAETLTISVHEATNFGVIAAPDRSALLINAQGSVWRMPFSGGKARRITDDFIEPAHMAWSPDGARVLLESYRDGLFHLWTMRPDGSDQRQLTKGAFDDIDPAWSPDGKQIAFVSDRGGNRDLWILDVASGAARRIETGNAGSVGPDVSAPATLIGVPSWVSEPAWSPDGKRIAFIRDRALHSVDLASWTVTLLRKAERAGVANPSWTPDGKRIGFVENGGLWTVSAASPDQPVRVGDKDDVFPFPATWLSPDEALYSANGRIWRTTPAGTTEVPLSLDLVLDRPSYARKRYDFDDVTPKPVKGIVGPRLSPDGKAVVFKALNDLWLLPIGGRARKLTDDGYYEIDPDWSPDGTRIAYAADAAGSQDLYVLDVATGRRTRVTSLPGAEVAPCWSPDGTRIAFATQTGEIAILTLADGSIRTLAKGLNAPGRASWSPDGRTLVFSALHDALNEVLTIDVATGEQHYRPVLAGRTLSPRGDDGPRWSADGARLLFGMDSTVHVQSAAGGPTTQLTTEASDAPSWSRDGKRILYLHNGALRLIEGGQVRTVPTGLNWRQDVPRQRLLIHAGGIWDGVHEAPRREVDILVVDNRIASITPRSTAPAPAGVRVIDARALMLVPGLFDMHNHQQLRSKYFGDRQGRAWLAYGVTSTRSTGDQVYRALEDKESLASGARVGPRYFMTGEMFEGNRVEWEFARPVADEAQLRLDLSRAADLGYDVIKTYVRFPFAQQAEVIGAAHRIGISVTSHYLYPGIAHGADGEEHLGGPTRWGYTEVAGRHGLYDDVYQTLTRTHFQVTTTNFSSAAGLASDPALVDDPRIASLYPQWERDDLRAKLACAQGDRAKCGFLPPDEASSAKAVQGFVRLLRGGAMVMAGTDSPLDSYALSLQLNLRSMAKHGMTNFETLQIATIIPARAQGVERDLGSIEPGKLADLVFVDGDPSRNMDDLAKVRMVMKAGRLFTIPELTAPFPAGK